MDKEGKEEELLECVVDRNINDQRYCIDDSKLKELGWEPSIEWEDGIRDTIAWYRQVPDDYWPEFVSALAPHPLLPGARPAPAAEGGWEFWNPETDKPR
ncbi:hypothetical protein T484DRAFT_1851276 [Baffinella frigidus]|nr:hypothetical protein T484DRAFT_1851276 [Cryptophyta sp. CCMP2293]